MLTLALALLAPGLPSSTQDPDRLFPLPSDDMVVEVGEEEDSMTMEDMVMEYSRLTDQHVLFDDETRGYLASCHTGLRRSLVIPKVEVQAMFEHLLDRIPDIKLEGEVGYLHSHFIDGVKSMPVKYTPQAA